MLERQDMANKDRPSKEKTARPQCRDKTRSRPIRGDGGGGTQTVNQVKEIPDFAKPTATSLLTTGMNAINQSAALPAYGGQRIAGLDPAQKQGLGMIESRALNGSPDENAARQQATDTLSGAYMSSNPAIQSQTYVPTNPYAGPNPYLSSIINQNADLLTNQYRLGTAAQTDSSAAMQRAFGGSAYNQTVNQNQQGLSKSIADMANAAKMADYGQQQQLAESGINRGVQAQQFDKSLLDQSYQQERQRQVGAIGMGLQAGQSDYDNAQKLVSAGDASRSVNQALLDQSYQDYVDQQNRPFQSIDRAGSLLGMAIGNTGATTQTTANTPARIGALAGGLGGAALGYGLTSGSSPVLSGVNPTLAAILGGLGGSQL